MLIQMQAEGGTDTAGQESDQVEDQAGDLVDRGEDLADEK